MNKIIAPHDNYVVSTTLFKHVTATGFTVDISLSDTPSKIYWVRNDSYNDSYGVYKYRLIKDLEWSVNVNNLGSFIFIHFGYYRIPSSRSETFEFVFMKGNSIPFFTDAQRMIATPEFF